MKILKLIMLFCFAFPFYAYSGVQVGATRVIYNAGVKQASITVGNPDKKPYLIQSWVAQKEGGKQNSLITVPPLFRLEPESENTVKILAIKPPQFPDRESLFWLNIKAIPSSDKNAVNTLHIAIRSRLKLFYRPKGLKGNPNTAYSKLQFTLEGKNLSVYNPTPYHVTFSKLVVNGKKINDFSMIVPYQKLSVIKPKAAVTTATPQTTVVWQAINDFGGGTAEKKIVLH